MESLVAAASIVPPQLYIFIALGILSLLLYHIRECSSRRREMYNEMKSQANLLHRIAGKLGVDD